MADPRTNLQAKRYSPFMRQLAPWLWVDFISSERVGRCLIQVSVLLAVSLQHKACFGFQPLAIFPAQSFLYITSLEGFFAAHGFDHPIQQKSQKHRWHEKK